MNVDCFGISYESDEIKVEFIQKIIYIFLFKTFLIIISTFISLIELKISIFLINNTLLALFFLLLFLSIPSLITINFKKINRIKKFPINYLVFTIFIISETYFFSFLGVKFGLENLIAFFIMFFCYLISLGIYYQIIKEIQSIKTVFRFIVVIAFTLFILFFSLTELALVILILNISINMLIGIYFNFIISIILKEKTEYHIKNYDYLEVTYLIYGGPIIIGVAIQEISHEMNILQN